jgi:hypothetical protein
MDGNSQFDWTFDVPGRHTVTVAVDVDNHVAESDENNNSHSLALTVGAGGRLRPACPPWPQGQTWYYTGGPHFDGLSGTVRLCGRLRTKPGIRYGFCFWISSSDTRVEDAASAPAYSRGRQKATPYRYWLWSASSSLRTTAPARCASVSRSF